MEKARRSATESGCPAHRRQKPVGRGNYFRTDFPTGPGFADRRGATSFSSIASHKTTPPVRFVFTWRDLPHDPQGFEQAADAVADLYEGEPVPASEVSRRIGIDPGSGNATRALCRAERAGMVRRVARSLWIPCYAEGKKP